LVRLGAVQTGDILLFTQAFSRRASLVAGAFALACSVPAAAQDDAPAKEPRRYRVTAGLQMTPRHPGSDDLQPSAMVNLDIARGDTPFTFEAPDDSFGFDLVRSGGFTLGPIANFEDSRTAKDVGTDLPKVGFSLELGGAVRFQPSENFRLSAELRKGVSGHEGWVGNAGADLVLRDGDQWLFSIGPRVTWGDDTYHDAWFGVAPADSVPSGLPAYNPGAGIHAYGATASALTRISRRWGLSAYAKYDRLTGDAADSPIVLTYGSRDQFWFGAGLTYTFGPALD